jgi:hypothetical protein
VDSVIVYQLSTVVGVEDRFQGFFFDPPTDRSPCPLPWTEMYVLPDGEIITCCRADLMVGRLGIFHMGDAARESLSDIWRGPAFSRYRRQLLMNDPADLPQVCVGCGIFTANATRRYTRGPYAYQENPFVRTVSKNVR